ncbi:hypothetical protein ACR79T_00010 [Sphingobacterium spiritivorum]|uniref:hypothetical protein n=1 Tax=Sphingobacterium spiritivorum TaxID=258 RepID=UPI003DA48B48
MNKLLNLTYCMLVVLFFSCSSDKNKDVGELGRFDISNDGKFIIYSWLEGEKSSIYRVDVDGKNVKLLINSSDNISYFNPSCSSVDEQIILVGYSPKSLKSSLWISNIFGEKLKQITDSSTLKLEAIFSVDGESIYYTQANEYTGNSPIGRRAAHDFDVYELKPKSFETKKITNLNSYQITNILDIDSSQMLLTINDKDRGIFFLEKKSGNLSKIQTLNDTLRNSTGYSNPVLLNNNYVVCSSYYELAQIDLKKKIEKIILPSSGVHFKQIRYNKLLNSIFFIKQGSNIIYRLNVDGTDLKEIEMNASIR